MNQQVLALAIKGHKDQFRKYSGLPYIVHPIEVAFKVQSFYDSEDYDTFGSKTLDLEHRGISKSDVVNAAACHDLLEDTTITEQEILDVSNAATVSLVKELTNPSKGSILSRDQRKAMDRKHLQGVSREAKIIKLIDRTCNLKDMAGAPGGFKRIYLEESKLLYSECLSDVDNWLGMLFFMELENLEKNLE